MGTKKKAATKPAAISGEKPEAAAAKPEKKGPPCKICEKPVTGPIESGVAPSHPECA